MALSLKEEVKSVCVRECVCACVQNPYLFKPQRVPHICGFKNLLNFKLSAAVAF